MQVKTQADDLQNYLTDSSHMQGGHADKLFIPSSVDELSQVLKEADISKMAVTISGARTGTVGGAIPFGGCVISLERLNNIKEVNKAAKAITAEAGVILGDLQKAVEAKGLFYPPDPTEWSCQIGGNVATNASGARSFLYGSTRRWVNEIRVVLAHGDFLHLVRGEHQFENGEVVLESNHRKYTIVKPTYDRPLVSKNASGYFAADQMDPIDLFIGSEGTLGVIVEARLRLLLKPEGFLTGIVFFCSIEDLLAFVDKAREISFENRSAQESLTPINATLLEYFDCQSLRLISEKFPDIPEGAAGAVFFEQETTSADEEELLGHWHDLFEKHHADLDHSWFATSDDDRARMRKFRHALPIACNERYSRYGFKKVSTDMAVPVDRFRSLLRFYEDILSGSGIEYVLFGHIGDCHLHANLFPKKESEVERSRHIYGRCVAQALMLGGTVSAEHGIGKLKRKYLSAMMGERYLNEMASIKRTLDPNGVLGRGNIFDESYL